ncbi:hypothetical protein HDU96_001491 [Phlyctochytrium bullatum]|nr:hypothetical protein HDU96_001491 [Phlyctochytrium bullatum]
MAYHKPPFAEHDDRVNGTHTAGAISKAEDTIRHHIRSRDRPAAVTVSNGSLAGPAKNQPKENSKSFYRSQYQSEYQKPPSLPGKSPQQLADEAAAGYSSAERSKPGTGHASSSANRSGRAGDASGTRDEGPSAVAADLKSRANGTYGNVGRDEPRGKLTDAPSTDRAPTGARADASEEKGARRNSFTSAGAQDKTWPVEPTKPEPKPTTTPTFTSVPPWATDDTPVPTLPASRRKMPVSTPPFMTDPSKVRPARGTPKTKVAAEAKKDATEMPPAGKPAYGTNLPSGKRPKSSFEPSLPPQGVSAGESPKRAATAAPYYVERHATDEQSRKPSSASDDKGHTTARKPAERSSFEEQGRGTTEYRGEAGAAGPRTAPSYHPSAGASKGTPASKPTRISSASSTASSGRGSSAGAFQVGTRSLNVQQPPSHRRPSPAPSSPSSAQGARRSADTGYNSAASSSPPKRAATAPQPKTALQPSHTARREPAATDAPPKRATAAPRQQTRDAFAEEIERRKRAVFERGLREIEEASRRGDLSWDHDRLGLGGGVARDGGSSRVSSAASSAYGRGAVSPNAASSTHSYTALSKGGDGLVRYPGTAPSRELPPGAPTLDRSALEGLARQARVAAIGYGRNTGGHVPRIESTKQFGVEAMVHPKDAPTNATWPPNGGDRYGERVGSRSTLRFSRD